MAHRHQPDDSTEPFEYIHRYDATDRETVWEPPGDGMARQIVKETDVPIPMRDGLDLAANVYRPETPGGDSTEPDKYPVILQVTGWGKDLYWGDAEEQFGEPWPGTGVGYESWSPPITGSCTFEAENHRFWVPQGYVVIVVDGRGFGRSPGTFNGFDAWGRDIYDAIEWAGKRAWSNGKVGMSGVSIMSILQYHAAAADPPHLEAICPWQGTPDDLYDHGGIGPVASPSPPDTFPVPHDPAWGVPSNTNPPAAETRTEDALFQKITQPALICGSWSSHGLFSRGDFRAFRTISSDQKWLYNHGREKWATFYQTDAQAVRKQFFDHFLKGTDERILDVPAVRYEVRETLRAWSVGSAQDFPLPDTDYRELSLDAARGGLVEETVPDESAVSYDSTEAESATFDITFEDDILLVGYHRLKLWVTPEAAPDADLFVTLRKLDQAGNEVKFHGYAAPLAHPVALGFLRLSHRKPDETRSTRWDPYIEQGGTPEKVTPGEPVECQVPIRPSGTRYRAGDTLRVEISGTFLGTETYEVRYPAREPGQTPLELETVNEGDHTIHTGGEFDTRLLIPEVPLSSEC